MLLSRLRSGTLGAVTLAVTVPPVAVIGTVMGALVAVAPGASVTAASSVGAPPLTTTSGVNVTVVLPLLDSVSVVTTDTPSSALGMAFTTTPGSLNSTLRLPETAVLLPTLLSGVVEVTMLDALSTAVAVMEGTVVVNVCVLLWPGASVPAVKGFTSPLDSVTEPVTTCAAVPELALLVKVTVPLATEPAGALPGSTTEVNKSAYTTPLSAVAVLLPGLLSTMPPTMAVTLADTVPPVAVMGTVITALVLVAPAGNVTWARSVGAPPLTETCGVNVTGIWPATLPSISVVVTELPSVPAGIGLIATDGSANSCVDGALEELLLAVVLSGVTVATVLVAFSGVANVDGIVAVNVCVLLAPGVRLATVKVRTCPP